MQKLKNKNENTSPENYMHFILTVNPIPMNHSFYFLDTETTESDALRASIVEIGIYYPTENGWYAIEERCKPNNIITVGAMATHHITPAMVEDKPKFSETRAFQFLRENGDSILIAHNAPYDVQVLKNEGINIPQERIIDTLNVAKHILDDVKIESYSLQYLRYFYWLDRYNDHDELPATMAHSAMYDTVVLKWLFQFLTEKIEKLHPGKNPLDEMVRLSTLPVILKVINFGKYRGKTFEEIAKHDAGYLDWLSRNSDDINIRATCQYWLKQLIS